jgi:chorismate mutase
MTQSETLEATPPTLAELREEIDRIDRELHARLIERGEIIDRLIAVKARQPGVSAFRPAREADMMRRIVLRHKGILPLATVESVWRIIISTFTYVQSPYTVHGDAAAGDARMRDSARFHFGFTVPLVLHEGARAVIEAVAAADGDLGLVRVEDQSAPWWDDLRAPLAPKIIARLPFVERVDHAAGVQLFIVAKPIEEGASRDILLYAVDGLTHRASASPFEIVATHGRSSIVAAHDGASLEDVATAFDRSPTDVALIGSHAARFEVAPSP